MAKRYAARDRSGLVTVAFGFDLRPLLLRHQEIAQVAREIAERDARLRRLREAVILRLRDCTAHLEAQNALESCEDELAAVRRFLRRKPDAELLEQAMALLARLSAGGETPLPDTANATKLSGKTRKTERHYQSSNPDTFIETPPAPKPDLSQQPPAATCRDPDTSKSPPPAPDDPLRLAQVLSACPTIGQYADHPIETWEDLQRSSAQVAPWLGIGPQVWQEARGILGDQAAAVTLAAMLEAGQRIKSPAAYLRVLCNKARMREFTPVAMIRALSRAAAPLPS